MSLSDPFSGGFEPNVGDSDLKTIGSGIYVMTAGNLKFKAMDGNVFGPFAVTAGQLIPFRPKQIMTGTTAAVIVGTN